METFKWFLVTAGIRSLEVIFVLGLLGSAVVFVMSAIDDLGAVFKKDLPTRETTEADGAALAGPRRTDPANAS